VVLRGGTEYVFSRGVTVAPTVSSGGHETVSVGGFASGITLLSGGVLTDDGETRIVGGGTLAGTLSGAGSLVVAGAGDLLLSGSGAAFAGRALIEGGTLELAKSGALGTGFVEFAAPASGSAVLQIDAADAPAAGGTFANVLSNFSAAGEDIDLPSIAFVAGAATNAKIVGSTLVLTEGGKTYKFTVAGSTAGAYPVLSDGHGGTLIDPEAARFAQTAAAFAPPPAAKTALARGSATGQTPFLHAAVSAGAARP
jgi:autotransporter-associated beta strand protein